MINIAQTEVPSRRSIASLGLCDLWEAPMPTNTIMSTARFIQRRNLELLRARLTRTNDKAECQRIVKLIEEEELKDLASGGTSNSKASIASLKATKPREQRTGKQRVILGFHVESGERP